MPADQPTKRRSGPKKVSFVGTYVPRRCGIATFSNDLLTALSKEAPSSEWWSVALNDGAEIYDYPPEVHFEIAQKSLADYRKAVDFLNMNQIEAVCLQHEFGIYGGSSGSYVLRPLEHLRMPVVTTLHTVLKEPNAEQRDIIAAIGEFSDRVVVMSEMAEQVLTSVYGIPKDRVAVIPHGVPDMPFLDTSYNKDQFDLVGKKVILTFGLLSEGKGLEYVIDAMPEIVRAHPDAIFAVLGATHPEVKRREGEAYRHMLQRKARDLGVADNVVFYNQFIDTPTLLAFLSAADVVVTPYLGREQIVSGVLSYALGAGKAIVSTPYWYAEEMLADGHGVLVPFRDAQATGEAIISLLSNETERNAMRKRAYLKARPMIWSEVAQGYLRVFRDVRRERGVRPRVYRTRAVELAALELPYPKLDHLRVLTDDTGILQHARFDIPDRDHGYCTDDNARALIVTLLAQQVLADKDNDRGVLAHRYLSFLQQAFNEGNGRFRNFMSYGREWQEEAGSEDSHGRAIWALGQTVLDSPSQGMAAAAMSLFERALPRAIELTALRACAYALLGIDAYLRRFSGATEVRRAQVLLAERLHEAFLLESRPDWPWPEEMLTYANGLLPHALIASGVRLGRQEMVETGLKSLEWLAALQIDPKGHFVPVGNRGWFSRAGVQARFDQQPIEVQHMADAALEAFRATGEHRWLDEARRSFEWFLGRNDLGQAVCDHATGGCRDGVQAEGLNQNQGAESTLAWLHSLLAMHVATGTATIAVRDIATARRPSVGARTAIPERAASAPSP
ncbi:MAG TPA: glycosyltransferase family 4 protein [Bauldia sp.]|nr:glycosyltransferase family 4 protein [Bauldia sp.]